MEQNEKVYSFKNFKKDAFKKKLKDTYDYVKQKTVDGIHWCLDHPVEAIGLASIGALLVAKGVKYKTVKTEERRRETEFYDLRTGMYAKSKRPLTAREKLRAEERYKAGENWSHILDDMRLLK